MQNDSKRIVVLGTGGTIAGIASDPHDNVGYRAGELGIEALVSSLPGAASLELECEQIAQLDSKDMSFDVWRRLAEIVRGHLARPEIGGIVITHGSDTLEETAYFLQRLLAPAKPVVLTAAMRPATALLSDGPQNLIDALQVARAPGASGVLVVVAGRVHGALDVRKTHPYRLDAFGSGDAGPIAEVEEGVLRRHRAWPVGEPQSIGLPGDELEWPWVEIVTSHAGARGDMVRMLSGVGVDGIVVAGTGNGTVHRELQTALEQAQVDGLLVLRCSRCPQGRVIDAPGEATLPSAGSLTPVQARVELILRLLARGTRRAGRRAAAGAPPQH